MCAFCLGQAFKLVYFLTRHIITVNSTQNQEAEKLQLPTFHLGAGLYTAVMSLIMMYMCLSRDGF